MSRYIFRRVVQSFILLLFISMLLYLILNLVPGGPFDTLKNSNPRITQSMIDRLNSLLDLDKPLLPGEYCPVVNSVQQSCRIDPGRYLRWLGKVTQGDFGKSWTLKNGTSVSTLIGGRIGFTLLLMGLSTFLAIIIAVPIGIYSAVHQYSKTDYVVTAVAFFGQSMPTFWTGLMAISIFAVALKLFPTGGVQVAGTPGDIIQVISRFLTFGQAYPKLAGKEWTVFIDGMHHVALPGLILTFFNLAGWIRYTRSSMLEVLRQDYMRTARAKGLQERVVIVKHGLRNALIPLVTIFALTVPSLFGGALITESIFSWPGMGRMLIEGITAADWPVVQGILVITSFLVVFSNLMADLLYAVVDPRISYS
jgi:peptide/nickel transport system permease protein